MDIDDLFEEDQELFSDAARPDGNDAHPDADAHPDVTHAAPPPTRKRSRAELMAEEDARIASLEAVMSGGTRADDAPAPSPSGSYASPSREPAVFISGSGSICKSEEDEANMLVCDGCNEGFHLQCVGLQEIPSTEEWYCCDCSAWPRISYFF